MAGQGGEDHDDHDVGVLRTRLSVPPKTAVIFDGEVSWSFGIIAPKPTAIDERPRHKSTHVSWCTLITSIGTCSIRSLRSTSSEQGNPRAERGEPELAPNDRVAIDRQQADNPAAVAFQADHRINEARGKRREDQPDDGQIE